MEKLLRPLKSPGVLTLIWKLEAGTTHLLTIINGYSGKEGLQEAADYMLELLKEFAASKDEELIYF